MNVFSGNDHSTEISKRWIVLIASFVGGSKACLGVNGPTTTCEKKCRDHRGTSAV